MCLDVLGKIDLILFIFFISLNFLKFQIHPNNSTLRYFIGSANIPRVLKLSDS